YEGTVGDHQIDLNMNTGSEANGFEMTLIPGSYCGYYNCDGTDVSLIFYDLDFSDGEELIGFDLTPGAINPIVTILGPDAISFTFVDTDYTSRGLFFSGEFITAVAAVPLPAAAWMLVAGLGGLGFAGRRRKTS
ncbi:MAG: VPLPA-CTERM sorting domain-containing protein, partial [Rhodobacteraceae bacterium]|nr:VPLPA-CTERM sorting domain-containing protein [Paracoccaceae bacterium]